MNTNKLIDIIIPAYNAHNTIDKAVMSIASQTISHLIRVTIVNDGSDDSYSDTVNKFMDFLDIKEITLAENSGCGAARNAGLDNTELPYIMFMDADDILYSPLSCARLLTEFQKNNNLNAAYGSIYEISLESGNLIEIPANHWMWIFGCMYSRHFLDEFHIRFYPNSAGEDTGFNKIIKLLSTPEIISFIPDVTYLWTDANKGNRLNTEEFAFDTSKPGYIENMIYAHQEIKRCNAPNETLILDAVVTMVSIYLQFLELIHYTQNREHINIYLEYAKRFYNEVYQLYLPYITYDYVLSVYNENLVHFMTSKNRWLGIDEITLAKFIDTISK